MTSTGLRSPARAASLAVALLVGCAAAGCGASGAPADARPNVLLVGIDTLRADRLGCYGHARDTSPTFDALAARGTLFEQAFAPTNWTLPGFASIFTGLYPGRHGAIGLDTRLPSGLAHVAERFRAAGYDTAGFHNAGFLRPRYGLGRGFEEWRPMRGFADLSTVDAWLATPRERPFFLFLHTYDVHAPVGDLPPEYVLRWVDPDHEDRFDLLERKPESIAARQDAIPFGADDFEHMRALYDGAVRFVDDQLGRLLGRMEHHGVLDDTLVVVISDHGEEFGEHGGLAHRTRHLYDELVHVPFVVAGPGIARGRRVAAPVQTVDLMPTLLELAGIGVPTGLDGRSIAAALRGGPEPGARPAISRFAPDVWSVRTARWSLVTEGDATHVYDRSADPGETEDLSNARPELVPELERAFREAAGPFRRADETADPPSAEELDELRDLGYAE